ncbi:MAG: hypothetical protein M1818_003651 [Claussenomyces sp. TS43310]|nr:MAG: hypothetical protein M1818_003651 [Claussenomyces sp. TS43310]
MAQAASASWQTKPAAFSNPTVGRKAHVFRPPVTPSASSSVQLARSTMSTFSEDSDRSTALSRKRTRRDYHNDSLATPVSLMGDWTTGLDPGDAMARSGSMDPGSPMPLVNTRYALAGGLDTPTAVVATADEAADSVYSDIRYRRDMVVGGDGEHNLSYFPRIERPFSAQSQMPDSTRQSDGWSKTALEVVGGVVGKVWEFCKAGAFRGFVAGGGTGYNKDARPFRVEKNFWEDEDSCRMGESTLLPGRFPDDDFIPDYMDNPTPDRTPQRPAKRRQLTNPDGELSTNWIMVSNVTNTASSTSTPTSTSTPPRFGKPTPPAHYNAATASSTNRRQTTNLPASRPASRAGVRRPLLSSHRASAVSHAGSPNLHSTRPASFASPRSPGGSKIPIPSSPAKYRSNSPTKMNNGGAAVGTSGSPAAAEAQRWAAKKKREEREAEESIQRFNKQLRDMIREGKEALGSRVVVEDEADMEDEEF